MIAHLFSFDYCFFQKDKLLFIALYGVMPFSCLGKKSAKRSRHKGHCASRRKRAESVPLCIPRRTYDGAEHLNLHPEHDKNVPIFAVQWFCFWNSAGRRERSRRHQQGRGDVPSRRENVTQFFRCVRVGYTGEVVLRAANQNRSLAGGKRSIVYAICRAVARHECLPCADFFGYFLVRRQESNTARQYDKL